MRATVPDSAICAHALRSAGRKTSLRPKLLGKVAPAADRTRVDSPPHLGRARGPHGAIVLGEGETSLLPVEACEFDQASRGFGEALHQFFIENFAAEALILGKPFLQQDGPAQQYGWRCCRDSKRRELAVRSLVRKSTSMCRAGDGGRPECAPPGTVCGAEASSRYYRGACRSRARRCRRQPAGRRNNVAAGNPLDRVSGFEARSGRTD